MADSASDATSPPPDEPARPAGADTLVALTRRAMTGDEAAFTQLHARVDPGVRALLMRRSGNRADVVEDISQKTWQSVYLALRDGRYDPARSAITTFVYAVATNAWLTHLRKFARQRGYTGIGPAVLDGTSVDDHPFAQTTTDIADDADLAETLDALRQCLRDDNPARLTEHELAVVQAIAAGETDRGLARRLGISSSTVNIRKHSGFAKIRAYFAAKGMIDPSAQPPSA